MSLGDLPIAGIVTELGGATIHAAIRNAAAWRDGFYGLQESDLKSKPAT